MTDKIARFEALMKSIDRPGIEKLLEFIRKSDFYTAPASTRFHSCHEGGLLEHSLNVYDCLVEKTSTPIWQSAFQGVERESIILSALLHDICKTYYYTVEMKNKKVYSDTGKKYDSNGRYDWQTVPAYTVDDKIPYGHGEKSVMMIEEFITLKPIERYMIRWHMCWTENSSQYGTIGVAIKKYPAILAISEADLEATYLLEKDFLLSN